MKGFMKAFYGDAPPAKGLQYAIERYGVPLEMSLSYRVSEDTLAYWKLVRRKRAAEVVILLRRASGRYLIHTKAFYPQGVYRLLSGGIHPHEDLIAALRRETYEETGLDIEIKRFLGIIHYQFTWASHTLSFASYLFLLVEVGGTLGVRDPQEAITGYREVTLSEIEALADQLEALPPDWNDWGRFRAAAHRLAVKAFTQQDNMQGENDAR